MKKTIAELTVEIEALRQDRSLLASHRDELAAALTDSRKAAAAWEDIAADRNNDIKSLVKTIDSLRTSLTERSSELNRALGHTRRLETRIEQLGRTQKGLVVALATTGAEIRTLNDLELDREEG